MSELDLATLHLSRGKHNNPDNGMCLLEAVSYVAGEPFTDQPKCVSSTLGYFGRSLNDALGDDRRQELIPLIPRLIGTAGDGLDEVRSYMELDWLIRTYLLTWLDLADMSTEATALRNLRRIVDAASARDAKRVVHIAREKVVANWYAACFTAAVPGRDSILDAALNAVSNATWNVDLNSVRNLVWDVVLDPEVGVARDVLNPTIEKLKTSAIALFEAMIRPEVEADA